MRMRSISLLTATVGFLSGSMAILQGCGDGADPGAGAQGQGGRGDQTNVAASGDEPKVGVELTSTDAPQPSVAPGGGDRAVVARVTVKKIDLFDREFLYGADLQYSGKQGTAESMQSLAIGHDIVRFQIVGGELQMVTDQSHQFESDVNKPGRLVHAFKILAETNKTLSFEIAHGSPTLATVIEGGAALKERTSWVRDVEYVPVDKLLMLETSIEAGDGGVYEFLESVYPREALVPKVYKPLASDPSSEPLAERFRFLSWGTVWTGVAGVDRAETQFANRFKLDANKPLEWYVTPNVPEEYLNDVKTGIEGWNRYSQAMWSRDMVAFKGRMPKGMRLGDPRYNIVNWDNVADAGAAYESQASDPLTGIQSHSLIYMPLAWINIGLDYWTRGELSEAKNGSSAKVAKALSGKTFLGKALKVACARSPEPVVTLQAKETPEDFAHGLLKGTLFHEVGHAWGLAHNFKGSLSFDDDSHPERFSTSIMDYDQYNLERPAFDSTASGNGPLLEYDRQIISALYNDAADIKDTDPVVPACEDGEADDVEGGVDPLCLRYDAGSDPTVRTLASIALVTNATATQGPVTSLPSALKRASAALAAPAMTAVLADANTTLTAHAATLRGLIGFYLTSGAGSIRYMTSITIPMLYLHKEGTLPASMDADLLRARQFEAVNFVAGLETLPSATSAALDQAVSDAEAWFKQTPAYTAVPAADRVKATDDALRSVRAIRKGIEAQTETATLAGLRRRVLASLVRVPTAPFAYTSIPTKLDYEEKAIALLERGLTTKVGTQTRANNERASYIGALRTFADTDQGVAAIGRVRTVLEAELAAAPDATSREALRSLIKAVNGG